MRLFYRCLLRAYPSAMRREYGAEMAMVLDAAWASASARGFRARARFAGRMIADFFGSLPTAWRERPRHIPPRKKDSMIATLFREFRQATRVLWHDRWSSAATILTLALAIGATTAVFSVVHAVLLKPLPYANPERLVRIWEQNVTRDRPRNVVSPANYIEWRERATSFSSMAVFIPDTVNLTGDGPAAVLDLRWVSWNMFDTLGVRPAVGRGFLKSESSTDFPRKAILSWRLWQRRYHGDPSVIGRSLRFDGEPIEVIGVMPAGFRLFGSDADVFWQIREDAATRQPRGRSWQVVARLTPAVTIEIARAEMNQISEQLEQKWPEFDTGWRTTVAPFADDLTGDARTPLLLLFAAVGVVLVAGCANTTNLLLARAAGRQREMALRNALGATRWHIVRQLLTEGTLLAALGSLAGLLVAAIALAGVRQYGERLGIPRLDESSLDATVLQFSLGVMALAAIVFSLVPASQLLRTQLSGTLASGGRWSTGRRSEQRLRQAIVVGQIACAVILVIGGALVTRSLARIVSVDPGFDPKTFTFTVSMPGAKYAAPDAKPRFFNAVLDQLRATEGVDAAGGIITLPLGGMGTATSFGRPDLPPPAAGTAPVTDVRWVIGDYFASMQIALARGRTFSPAELANGAKVCVISEAAARQLFGDENPVGRFISVEFDGGPDEVIGVAKDVHIADLTSAPRPMVYYTFSRVPYASGMHFTVRSDVDAGQLAARAAAIVREIDSDVPVTDANRMSATIGIAVASPQLAARVVGAFAGLALLLSIVGVGALLAALVASRIPEFGVRLALGATPANIRRAVLSQGGRLIAIGLGIGLVAASLAASALDALLFGVNAADPLTYAGSAAIIAILGLIAADIPARRATRANPSDALR